MIGLLLVEDHAVVREGLQLLLQSEPDFEVLAATSTAAEALSYQGSPDVIVADLILPDARGPDVVSRLHAAFPDARILVLTMLGNPTDVRQSLAAGARGYLLKEAAASELSDAVRRVHRGEAYLQPSLGAVIAAAPAAESPGKAGGSLSPRELEVLRLVALGHTNAEAAAALRVSVRTVETHRAHILQKLGLRTRADLVKYAFDAGLI